MEQKLAVNLTATVEEMQRRVQVLSDSMEITEDSVAKAYLKGQRDMLNWAMRSLLSALD